MIKRKGPEKFKGKSSVVDMTKGSEFKLLIQFTIPMLIGNIFQQFYNMVDSIIVGRVEGANALGAVGLVGGLLFLFFSLCLGLGAGIGILTAQYFGAGDELAVKKTIGNAVYITITLGLCMGLICLSFADPVLKMMGTPAESFQDARTYLRVVGGATVVVASYNAVSSILRALGDSKTPLIFLIFASFVNVILDIVFVVGFRWGVLGVALATVISQLVAALGSIIYALKYNKYFRLTKDDRSLDEKIIKQSIRMGLPLALQYSLIAISTVGLQRAVNQFGAKAMAAYTVTGRIEQIVQQPYNCMGTALATFVGQNAGAGNIERIHSGRRKATVTIGIISLAMTVIMYMAGESIVRIFIEDVKVIKIAVKGLQITAPLYFFLGMIYVMRSTLNGVGDVGFALLNGICEVICRIGIVALFIHFTTIGMWGIWWTNGLTWTIAGGLAMARVAFGKWKDNIGIRKVE